MKMMRVDGGRFLPWAGAAAFAALLPAMAFAQKPADEQLATLRAPEGFEIGLFASEPMISNPSAIEIDTRGRVWVAEIQWYRRAAKNPPADCIKVLEDTDGDGKADKSTVFAEGIFAPMSICVAGTKVYVATSPDLWVFEDKDGDLKADGPPTKLLTGFGGHNHDHGAHSLVLGPDHKWWMAHGDTGLKVTGVDGSKIESRWGAMIRGELDGSKLEAVALNFRNPYEIAVDSFGESYCSDNDNDGNRSVRICWILEGGDYGWFGGPPFGLQDVPKRIPAGTPFADHWHFRGHIPGNVPGTLITGFGSPCGMNFYEGDAFGEKYKNAPWHADAGPREVRIYRHAKAGYGMKATSENILTTAGDNYFRPDDVCAHPDGSVLVSDWYDGGVGGHAYNDPERGRIFRLTPKGKKLARAEKPGPYESIEDAIGGLKSPNLATQFLARERLLTGGQESISALSRLLSAADPNHRARALWVLDRIGGGGRDFVVKELQSPEGSFRALAVRILRRHGAEKADLLFAKIGDSDSEVRREVLLAAAKSDTPAALDVIAKAAADFDGTDRYLLEALNIAARNRKDAVYEKLQQAGLWTPARLQLLQLIKPEAAAEKMLASLSDDKLPTEQVRPLLAAVAALPQPEAGKGLLNFALRPTLPAETRGAALELISGNLGQAWKPLAGDPAFADGLAKLWEDDAVRPAVRKLIAEQRLTSFVPRLKATVGDAAAAGPRRQEALVLLTSLKPAGLSDTLRGLLADKDESVRSAALDGLIELQDLKTLRALLAPGKADAAVQKDVLGKLMQTTGGALVLLRLIDEKQLDDNLRNSAVASALSHPDSNVRLQFEKFVPEEQRPKRLGAAFKPAEILALTGNPARGEQIFFQSSAAQCKNCHIVRGVGSTVGPDLSQIGKKFGPEAMLESILLPSKAISHEYVPYLVETTGGQVHVGFLIEKSDKQVVLKDIQNKVITVPAAEVAEMEKQEKSLMPELVLKDVTAQDAADLLAFLGGLKEDFRAVTQFKVIGPFNGRGNGALDRESPVEKEPGAAKAEGEYVGIDKKKVRWTVVATETAGGFPAIDTVKLANQGGLPSDGTAYYFRVTIDSTTEQDAIFQIGSDDSVAVWLNGAKIHRNDASRPLAPNSDRVTGKLKVGRNVFLAKVINSNGPGGFCLSVGSAAPVTILSE